MKRTVSSLVLVFCVLSAAGLHAAVRVYMLPEVRVSGDDVYVSDVCKVEGEGSAKYCELAIPPSDYRDSIIDRSELERFLKSSYNGEVLVFGNGTMVSFEQAPVDRKGLGNCAVKRGDPVHVVLVTGNITIRMTGRSLSDGAVSDEIEIRLTSGKRIRCVVTGEREAKVL